MNTIPNTPNELWLDRIADELVEQGYIICDGVIDPALTAALYQRIQRLDDDAFQRAGVGREQDQQLNAQIRRDQIRWLDVHDASEAAYLAWMDQLRHGLNRRLFMGLFDYECHFAHYAPGAFYKRHVDAFRGQTNRILTTVFYLNTDWQTGDGGELLVYPDHEDTVLEQVEPKAGRLVVFLSDRFPHEVLPAKVDRYSIAGWFRVNASIGNQIDPPR
ncbi:MAG: 2OG-Fe(II) oxygenase [Oceanospirillales bacterium]|nr:2OG-Fe(II) oxygenase [Oceanospirillales bacterium]